MKTTSLDNLTKNIKATAVEMVKEGHKLNEVANQIAATFNHSIARLVVIDIALDLGRFEEAKEYMSKF